MLGRRFRGDVRGMVRGLLRCVADEVSQSTSFGDLREVVDRRFIRGGDDVAIGRVVGR